MGRPEFRKGDRVAIQWEDGLSFGTVVGVIESKGDVRYKVKWDNGTTTTQYEATLVSEEAYKRSLLSEMLGMDVGEGDG